MDKELIIECIALLNTANFQETLSEKRNEVVDKLKAQLNIHSVIVPKGTLCCNEGDEIMDENGSVICKVCKKVICI